MITNMSAHSDRLRSRENVVRSSKNIRRNAIAGGRNSRRQATSSRSIEVLNLGYLLNSRPNIRSAFAADSSQRMTKVESPGPAPSTNTWECNGLAPRLIGRAQYMPGFRSSTHIGETLPRDLLH